MPYIILQGCDTTRCMQTVDIIVKVNFRPDFFQNHQKSVNVMLNGLEEKIIAVLDAYFENGITTDQLTNHQAAEMGLP